MKTWMGIVAIVLACASFALAAKEDAPIVVTVTWDISLDADGRVTKLATDDRKVPKAHAQLEDVIRSWRFSPGKLDGRRVATDTHLHVRLAIRRVEQQYELEIVRASTGPDYHRGQPPKYPELAAKMRKQGVAVLYVEYDGGGKVTRIEPARDAPKPNARLLKAAMDSVSTWTFSPEVVGGRAMAGFALVPVCFQLPDEPRSCAWKNDGTGESMDGDDAVAMNPAATLVTEVAGRTL